MGARSVARASTAMLLVAALAVGPAIAHQGRGSRAGSFHGVHSGGHIGVFPSHRFSRGPVHFRHSRAAVGVFIGAPIVAAPWWYYPPPPAYYDYPSYAQPAIPLYEDQGDRSATPPQPMWWYCPDSKSYYPYVKACPGGWQQGAPVPPPPS
jgi:hypothetical protein